MTKPVITSSGTRAQELDEQITDALYAVVVSIENLEIATPHVRDYYPKGMHFYDAALREHKDRLERLKSVRDELKEILDHIHLHTGMP